mmetsp:Transcript_24868/g.37074  ORF Transcript_24868/g.37074 Transcript_24868/m.37074 type:complete len:471 (-) Transcript_24868:685-2097(-)
MGKKTAAKIRRNQKRAEARGEAYEYTPPSNDTEEDDDNDAKVKAAEKLKKALSEIESNSEMNSKERRTAKRKAEAIASEESGGCAASDLLAYYEKKNAAKKNATQGSDDDKNGNKKEKVDRVKLDAATKLEEEMNRIELDTEMNAKERRSAKKKAEAIALEESKCNAAELLSWYEETKEKGLITAKMIKKKKENISSEAKKDPCIVFIGQLSYTTTKDQIFQHFQNELGSDVVTPDTLSIRLLTDPTKNNKSRGMAFIETTDPELMYNCLKLHHTHLDGRRINVERSAGGNKGSEARQNKLKRYRTEQEEYLSETVNKILEDYKAQGDLNESELDDGVIALCKRHSPHVVSAALSEYVEARGGHMENPSAYLTHIIGRIAVEGQEEHRDKKRPKKSHGKDNKTSSSNQPDEGKGTDALGQNSEFTRSGIDMSVVNNSKKGRVGSNKRPEMSQLFPSMNNRGRGRGRGYMR